MVSTGSSDDGGGGGGGDTDVGRSDDERSLSSDRSSGVGDRSRSRSRSSSVNSNNNNNGNKDTMATHEVDGTGLVETGIGSGGGAFSFFELPTANPAAMPYNFEVRNAGTGGVWTKTQLPKGVKYGPFLGKWGPKPVDSRFAWEVSEFSKRNMGRKKNVSSFPPLFFFKFWRARYNIICVRRYNAYTSVYNI